MKISASNKYPGYDPVKASRAEVYLNGEKMTCCVAADSDLGTAMCGAKDKHGNWKVRDGEIVMEQRCGNVCIFMPDEES